jgi:Putative TM nitroreductase
LKSTNLEFVILMAFGKTNLSLHRMSISEFKRKPLSKITDIIGADELLEPVRLSPSAGNSQPWFFTGDESMIHAYSVKPNFIRGLLTKKYTLIDIGIALYHLKVAAEHFSKTVEILFEKNAEENTPKGYKYVASLRLE